MALIADGKLEEGISELLEAYRIRPHATVLFNVARAQEKAGRTAEALATYQRYLLTNPPDALAVRATVELLEAQQARKPELVTPPPPRVEPQAVPHDEASLKRLAQLTDRLERALEQVERRAPVAPPAPAAPPTDEGADFRVPYDETVVAASRRAQSALEAPNAITVISGDEVRASGLTTLPEVLRRVPGAEVMAMGYSSANVSLRGFNQRVANKVLVLIDGRPEYQDFLGLTLWSAIPVGLEEIDRLEVIRGAGLCLVRRQRDAGGGEHHHPRTRHWPPRRIQRTRGQWQPRRGQLRASGGDAVKYRASVGYEQADKYSLDYQSPRPDVRANMVDPNLSLRAARGNLTGFYALNRDFSLAVSGGVSRLLSEVYGIGLLRNYVLDGVSGYAKADLTAGPVKVRFFWNTSSFDASPQYEPIGQRSLATHVDSNVFDGELFFQREFELAGHHAFAAGASARLKRVKWGYLGPLQQEVHAAAFLQDEWRIIKPLALVASYRIDRHPLLDRGQPGYAQSPRVSLVATPFEGQAFRGSFATAFRQPTFLESYMDIRTPVPGVNGASVLTQGNRALKPERLISFELGYRGEVGRLGLSWDLALYWNLVTDLVVISAVAPVQADQAYDAGSSTFLLGRSTFINDPLTYTARGGELGLTWNALDGLDLRASAAAQQVVANLGVGACGPCTQAPALKVSAGFVYRTPVHLDLSADLSFVSATTWVEREPSATDPTQIANLKNPLGAFAVINARVAYRFLEDRLTVAVVGSQLGANHQEHPFGNTINRRIFAQITVQP
jgi:outer membrane receptor protein involved in Fe transport